MRIKECLSFDDVLLEPQYSSIESRSQVNLSSKLNDEITLSLPVISAPMDTVTEWEMAIAMNNNGGLGIIHRYNTIEEQCNLLRKFDTEGVKFAKKAAAIGVTGDYLDRAKRLVYECECQIICIDVAHGFHKNVFDALKYLQQEFKNRVHIMVGNVATYEAAQVLAENGANSIKVGIGGGSICSTRIMTGHGVPTFQSIMDCSQVKEDYDVKIIADGGIRTPGDIAKAIGAGADFVMLGSMLAGTDETPGKKLYDIAYDRAGKECFSPAYKIYRGMASEEAQMNWRGKVGSKEGISSKVACKGPVKNILDNIKTNLASAFSYSGYTNMREFQLNAKFIKQTSASQIESSTHILNAGGKLNGR